MADSEGSPGVEVSSGETPEELVGALKAEIAELQKKLQQLATAEVPSTRSDRVSTPGMPYGSFRKDFKISGTIGELGQKDKLTFSSLIHQINAGKKKKYPEVEIIHAVIKAMSPGLKLRSYLEGRDDITLAILRKLLRCHFREKDATELYQELCSLTQQTNEIPQEFVFRALDLRQKVGFASQEDGSMLAYNQSLVQSMFLHAIGTGLRDANIAQELKPFFTKQDILDGVLLEQVNLAARDESERQQKMTSKKKLATTAQLKADNREVEPKPKKENPLFNEVQELKKQVADILATNVQPGEFSETSGRSKGPSQRE